MSSTSPRVEAKLGSRLMLALLVAIGLAAASALAVAEAPALLDAYASDD